MNYLALLSTHGYDVPPPVLFDDRRMEPGNHLRWVIRSDMGLPQRFILHRSARQNILQEVNRIRGENKGKDYFKVILPLICAHIRDYSKPFAELNYTTWNELVWLAKDSPNESSLRAQFGATGQTRQLRSAMAQLFEVQLNWAGFNPQRISNMHQKTLRPAGAGQKTQISTLDAIQLAALDPYIARMVGFYYIDRQPTFPAHGYIVEADYGNRLWPLSYREPRRPNGYALLLPQEDLGGVAVLAPIGRLVYEWSNRVGAHLLTIRGLLRLRFEEPAQEVILWYESDRTEESPGTVEFLPEVAANFARETKGLWKLTLRSSVPLLGFDIKPKSQASWKIQRIEWRRRTGPMGIIASNCTIVNRAEPSQPPQPPSMTTAVVSPAPLVLRHQGVVIPGLSDLRLSFLKPTGLPLAPDNPVRMLYGRMNGTAIAPLNKTELAIVPQIVPELPTLRLWMPLDGTYANLISGRWADANGTRFIKGGPEENADRFSLLLHGNNALSLPLETGLKMPGAAFSVFAWVKVDNDLTENVHVPVFSNGVTNGFSLGVWRTGNACKTHLVLNGRPFESSQTYPSEQWVPIGFNYNGSKIRLFTSSAVREFDTALSNLRFNSGGVGIGGNFDGSYSGAPNFFRGQIADVSVWSEAINWWEAKGRIARKKDRLAQPLAATPLVYLLPTRNYNTASGVMKIDLPALGFLHKELSIHAWVNIQPGRSYPTIIGNDWASSFWLGLESPSNQLKCWLNGRSYLSRSAVPLNRWVQVALSIEPGALSFYIDGVIDTAHSIPNEPIRPNAAGQPLRVGGDTNDTFLLLGSVADWRIYPFAVAPDKTETEYGIFNYTDRSLAAGTYTYRAANIDLFGRVSDWGSATTQLANSPYQINAPLSVRAEVDRIRLSVSAVRFVQPSAPSSSDPSPKGYWEVVTADELRLTEGLLATLPRNEIVVEQQKSVPVMGKNAPPETRTIRQNFEIKQVSRQTGATRSIVWELWDIPFAQLQIQPGNFFELQYHAEAQLEWQWSGLQQVFNPGVDTFQVFARSGPINEWQGRVTAIAPGSDDRHWSVTTNLAIPGNPNELTGQICTIDKQAFVAEGHSAGANAVFRLRYDGYPVIAPDLNGSFVLNIPEIHSAWRDASQTTFWETAPPTTYPLSVPAGNLNPATSTAATFVFTKVSDLEINDLRSGKNVDWLENDDTFWRIRFSNFPRPVDAPMFAAQDYVPAALVVNQPDAAAGPNGVWDAWYVHWHEWGSDNTLTCWVSLKDEKKGSPIVPPTIRIGAEYPVKFYSGRKFYATGAIQPPTDGQEATLLWHFAVSARAMTVPHRYAVSRFASLVAVDRRRPPAPPRPEILSIAKADVHGQSEAVVRWDVARVPLAGFNLYRATDTAIYSRDLDQRRLRQGYYAENHPLADDGFGDADGDVHEFLRAVQHKDAAQIAPKFHEVFAKPLSALTFEDLFATEKNDARWQALNLIWQYWADRFYPALSDLELRNLAERKGNETAFTLVNDQPIPNLTATGGQVRFLDKVNGVVSNRYFYRLRTMATNLTLSTEWGTVSDGKGAAVPASKPRTPVWTKVEAGDREIRLEWALNREKDLKEYVLLRSTQPALLNDIRWAEITRPEGLSIAYVKDPRIYIVRGNQIIFPTGEALPAVETIQGIYRSFEFDTATTDPTLSPAMNLAKLDQMRVVGNALTGIRKTGAETEVVLVLSYSNGSRHTKSFFGKQPYSVEGLMGLQAYYFVLLARNKNNILSDAGPVQATKTLEIQAPNAPQAYLIERVENTAGDVVRLQISCEADLEIMIQIRETGENTWKWAQVWARLAYPVAWSVNTRRGKAVELKIWSRTINKLNCEAPFYLYVP